ncbi:hypothetical protein COMA2_10089 [Candidatus Nitrospira nitrificans]|uniref:Uncharacterized protein n=1 Tax=Candidatus Nitrospira nitrificans TaxID=1742973 RepID=A0A0S4L6K7_9BACT|nr:hypothetical protein COMA2_10089 [Candidatus Nitrospira nitrificans]
MRQARCAIANHPLQQHFRIGSRTKPVSKRFKVRPQFLEIVNFPIEDQCVTTTIREKRLMAPLVEIKDAEANMAEVAAPVRKGHRAEMVGTAMPNAGQHRTERRLVVADDTGNPTHVSLAVLPSALHRAE